MRPQAVIDNLRVVRANIRRAQIGPVVQRLVQPFRAKDFGQRQIEDHERLYLVLHESATDRLTSAMLEYPSGHAVANILRALTDKPFGVPNKTPP